MDKQCQRFTLGRFDLKHNLVAGQCVLEGEGCYGGMIVIGEGVVFWGALHAKIGSKESEGF